MNPSATVTVFVPTQLRVYSAGAAELVLSASRADAEQLPPEQIRKHMLFTKFNGQFMLSPLPDQALREDSAKYLLVQRAQPGERLPLGGAKLASPSRLLLVKREALRGIPFAYVPFPAFPHAFGLGIDFYELTAGEEWEFAVRENALAFDAPPALDGSLISLFMREN